MRSRIAFALVLLAGLLSVSLVGPAQAVAPASITSQAGLLPLVHTRTSSGDLAGNVTTRVDGMLVPTGAASALASFPFNGWKYNQTYVCQLDNIGGGYYYPTIQAGNFLEAGASPIVLANDNGETLPDCQSYTDAQTLEYRLTNDSTSNSCWTTVGNWQTINTWKIWTHSVAKVNVHNPLCGNTAQARANTISMVTGSALGLVEYFAGNGDNCIMNSWYNNDYYYAGACDTGRLGWLY